MLSGQVGLKIARKREILQPIWKMPVMRLGVLQCPGAEVLHVMLAEEYKLTIGVEEAFTVPPLLFRPPEHQRDGQKDNHTHRASMRSEAIPTGVSGER